MCTVNLVERTGLLDAAEGAIARARERRGGMLVFEGPAGIGKSSLLTAAAQRAGGMRVVWARPTELERWFVFGVARRLLAPLVGDLANPERAVLRSSPGAAALGVLEHGVAPQPAGDDARAVVHGFWWLLADLAARAPLLLVIDDGQWADDASIGWLAVSAARLRDVPAVVLLATRTVDPRDGGALPRLMAMRDDVDVRPVPPLSARAVGALVARELGPDAAVRGGDRAARATGGNPSSSRSSCGRGSAPAMSSSCPPRWSCGAGSRSGSPTRARTRRASRTRSRSSVATTWPSPTPPASPGWRRSTPAVRRTG